MSAGQRRFRTVVERIGEPITIDSVDQLGIAVLLSPTQARLYISDSDLSSLTARPMFTVYLPFEAVASVGDVVASSRGTGEIRRVVELKVRGETLGKLVVVA